MKIYGKEVDEKLILQKINRPVKHGFVIKIAENYLMQNPKILDSVSKGKVPKKFVKDIRKILHKITGAYLLRGAKKSRREKLLDNGEYEKILKTSRSTKERSYGLLYEEIFYLSCKPKKILDLGSGINPVSLHKFKNIEVIALDINNEDVNFLNKYFRKIGKGRGKAELFDLNKTEKLKKYKADLGLMFKVADLLDLAKGHKQAEKVIKSLNVKWLAASFATKTLCGKDMNFPYRGWFERMLERVGWKYKKLIKPNEVFYVIKVKS